MVKGLIFLLILLACGNKLRPSDTPEDNPVITDTTYHMDILHPLVTQSLKSIGANSAQIKFVEVEIVHVVNPKDYPVSFTVYYHPKEKEPVLLGMFSLYPATNPGTFIVPSKGMLERGGQIELLLKRPEDFQEGDEISIEVKEMRFVRGE